LLFVAPVSEITPKTTQVSETLETELSTAILPFSVSVVLGLLFLITNLSNALIYFYLRLTGENIALHAFAD
jgi:hypothetical protein